MAGLKLPPNWGKSGPLPSLPTSRVARAETVFRKLIEIAASNRIAVTFVNLETNYDQRYLGRLPVHRGHVSQLDGLRGVAACVVVLTHTIHASAGGSDFLRSAWQSPLVVLLNPQVAVQTFFVLSGLVLAASLSRNRGLGELPYFYVRRVFRIHPPYLAALLFAWVASFLYGPLNPDVGPLFDRLAQVHLSGMELLRSFTFPGSAFLQLPVGWTLEIEMIFSFLLPLMLLAAVRSHWAVLIALCLVPLLIPGAPKTLLYALDFAFGITLFLQRERLTRWIGGLRLPAALLLLAVSQVVGNLPRFLGWYVMEPTPTSILFQSVGSAALVASIGYSPVLARFFQLRPCLFLGRISYSLYLVHAPLALVLASLAFGGADGWVAPATFVLAILLSAASFRWVERPAIAAGNRICTALATRLGSRPAGTRWR